MTPEVAATNGKAQRNQQGRVSIAGAMEKVGPPREIRKDFMAITTVELGCGGRGTFRLFGTWEEGMATA